MTSVLFIGKVWPEPRSSAAGSRMMQLIRFFAERNYQVYFGTAAAPSAYGEDLSQYGVCSFDVRLNHGSFDQQLKTLSPDIVVFDRYMTEEQYGWRVAENCPGALRILDMEDLHFLRADRERAIKNTDHTPEFLSDIARRELASVYRCDLSLVISAPELALLVHRYQVPAALLMYLPYLLDQLNHNDRAEWRTCNERRHFISIGNYLHAPNTDALYYLKAEIWPLIRRRLPEAELHVYGAYGDAHSGKLNDPKRGFHIKGWAENSREVMSTARVCLAPLRFGAGLKGKLVEAMSCGTPSVTTTTGAEGLGDEQCWPGMVANEPNAFAEAAVRLYTEDAEWQAAADKILPAHNAVFDRQRYEQLLEENIRTCREHLPELRRQNITGALLSHNLQHAKRWLGKYLELKNLLQEKAQHESS